MTILSGDNITAVCAVVFGLAWLGFFVDTLAIGRKISGVVWVLCLGMLLSNFKVIPFSSPVYNFVGGTLVPLAIPLLLFKSNLRRIFKESGRVMLIFLLASIGTIVGAIVGFHMFELGEIGPKVAGVYSGGYIGGAVNFLAVSQVVEMTSDEFSAAISASSIVSVIALMVLLATPSLSFVLRHFSKNESTLQSNSDIDDLKVEASSSFKLTHISGAIALSFAICSLSSWLSDLMDVGQYSFLIITIITLVIANLCPKLMESIEGEFDTGLLLMYLFFAIVGAGTDMSQFAGEAFVLFFYALFIIAIHLIITFGLAKFFRFGLEETVVASGAALVGPAVTAAIATSRGWKELVTPGIMCGIFGYAIASFIGVAITKALS